MNELARPLRTRGPVMNRFCRWQLGVRSVQLVQVCAIADFLVSGQDLPELSSVDEAATMCILLKTVVLGD